MVLRFIENTVRDTKIGLSEIRQLKYCYETCDIFRVAALPGEVVRAVVEYQLP